MLAEVRYQMKQNLDENKSKMRKIEEECDDSYSPSEEGGEVPIEVEQPTPRAFATKKVKTSGCIGKYFPLRTTLGAQSTLKCVIQNKQVIQKCDLDIAKWFIDASVPFNVANSTCFHPMIGALCSMSLGYKAPSMHNLWGNLLNS